MAEKKKSIVERFIYAYGKKVKKWMYCPVCYSHNYDGKMEYVKKKDLWICEDCGFQLSNAEFEDDMTFWWCDNCRAYLNNQAGFNRYSSRNICQKCGYVNDTSDNNLSGICVDCGKTLRDPDAYLCVDCRYARHNKAKKDLVEVGIAAIKFWPK